MEAITLPQTRPLRDALRFDRCVAGEANSGGDTRPDDTAVSAAFAQPNNDGTFPDAFASYLAQISLRREIVLFAFAPKAAGTFLRTAAINAVDGQLARIVHAQGGRDAQLYLPVLISYYAGERSGPTFVAHIHMQALASNRALIEALDLKPVVMVRGIPDMLASYWDMLETDDAALRDGLNCLIPADFRSMPSGQKGDFLIDVLGPWYSSYFATWLEYRRDDPDRVCLLNYADFKADPAGVLEIALRHARVARSRPACEAAIASAWEERDGLRFNRGESGRGARYFTTDQIARLERVLSYYPVLESWKRELLSQA